MEVFQKGWALEVSHTPNILTQHKRKLKVVMWYAHTDPVTTHPFLLVWNRVLTGMHPNSVTVLMYFAAETEVGQRELRQHNQTSRFTSIKQEGSYYTERPQKVMCYSTPHDMHISSSLVPSYSTWSPLRLQLSPPVVDQQPLSWTRWAACHSLPHQGSILRDG